MRGGVKRGLGELAKLIDDDNLPFLIGGKFALADITSAGTFSESGHVRNRTTLLRGAFRDPLVGSPTHR